MPDDVIDFTELLKSPLNSFKDPGLMPAGKHFYGKITSWETGSLPPRKGETNSRPFIQCNLQATDPGEDCTPEDIEGIDLKDQELNYKFWVTKKALPRLRRFLTSCGFSEDAPLGDAITESRGLRVVFSGTHTESATQKDEKGKPVLFYNIDSLIGA